MAATVVRTVIAAPEAQQRLITTAAGPVGLGGAVRGQFPLVEDHLQSMYRWDSADG